MKRSLSLDSGLPTLDKVAGLEASDEDSDHESRKATDTENSHKQKDSKPGSVQDNGLFNFQQAIQLTALSDPNKNGVPRGEVKRRSVRRTTEDLTIFVRNTRVLRLDDFRRISQLATIPGPNGQKLIRILEDYDRIAESKRIERTDESSGLLKQQSQQIKCLQHISEDSVESPSLRKKWGMHLMRECLQGRKSTVEELPQDLSKLLLMHRRAQIDLKLKHLDAEMNAALKHSEQQRELIRQILHEYHEAQNKTLLRRNRESFRQLQRENRSSCIQFLGLMGMMRLRYKGIIPSNIVPSGTDREESFALMQLKKLINGQMSLLGLLQRRHENERQSVEVALDEERNVIEDQFLQTKEILSEQSLALHQ
ncbi:hypothetical protein Ciccas_012521 [Cichlidogyrus casuarinus]|uniref:Uncharacterized protein n=1 Tax=Cichlidogyrus casuarinus TaxID=1844966 RepID=A0ABD2PN91_9PLAT